MLCSVLCDVKSVSVHVSWLCEALPVIFGPFEFCGPHCMPFRGCASMHIYPSLIVTVMIGCCYSLLAAQVGVILILTDDLVNRLAQRRYEKPHFSCSMLCP